MNNKLRIKDRRGSLLIESIVSISVVLIGFLGILGLLSRSLGINKDVSQKFIATYLSAEGIEIVKSLIDKDIADGIAWNDCCEDGFWEAAYDDAGLVVAPELPNYLLLDGTDGSYAYVSGDVSPFTRVIQISESDRNDDGETDEIKVNSRVSWLRHGVIQEIDLESHFFDWR